MVAVAVACGARLVVGSGGIGWPTGAAAAFVQGERLSRLMIAATAGAALAASGVALQALLRNPLAEPYILGLSTGAAAGMMAQWLIQHAMGVALGMGSLGAVLGAGVSMGIVYAAGRRGGAIHPLALLLTGVVLSTINGAILLLLNYAVGPGGLRDDMAQWMMGHLRQGMPTLIDLPWGGRVTALHVAMAVTLGGVAVLWARGRAMDVGTLSEAEASSLGVDLPGLRRTLFVVASVLAAGAVVLAGPVAFVGLVAPHVARLALGPAHRPLALAAPLLGAGLVVAADTTAAGLAFTFPGIGVLPVGIFTAVVGGVVFLWMLRREL